MIFGFPSLLTFEQLSGSVQAACVKRRTMVFQNSKQKLPRLYKQASRVLQKIKEEGGSVKTLVYEAKHPVSLQSSGNSFESRVKIDFSSQFTCIASVITWNV